MFADYFCEQNIFVAMVALQRHHIAAFEHGLFLAAFAGDLVFAPFVDYPEQKVSECELLCRRRLGL